MHKSTCEKQISAELIQCQCQFQPVSKQMNVFFFHNFVPRKTYITRVRTPIADKNEKYSFK